MPEVLAPIIRERPEDFDDLEVRMREHFKKELYLPLVESLGLQGNKVLNSNRSFLIEKIADGKIAYYRGKFTGQFSARSTRALKEMGAKWSAKDKGFKLHKQKLPDDVLQAIATSATRFEKTVELIKAKLRQMLPANIAESFDAAEVFDNAIYNVDSDLTGSLQGITVVPQLTDKARIKIAAEYNLNLQRYIKDWTDEEIIRLRHLVEKEAMAGKRYENLVKIIERRYDVSRNKAKFLARQETGLMMAKFREVRYVEAGSPGYYWTTVVGSPNHPVRPMHKDLDGKFIRWDDPPITNPKGDRNHAGEDYNCRCAPRAVIRF